jgi:DNA-binding MarR family transcriptional regulator
MKQISEAFGRRLSVSGLTRIQWIALYYINEETKITQTMLSSRMQVNDSSGGRLIDRLERDGLVKRINDIGDRRIRHIILTDVGQTLIDETIPIADQFNTDLIEGISPEDIEICERVMKKMVINVCE